jgi:hypothetical protein
MGFDVIAIRHLCAEYFEKNVSTALNEIKQEQAQLRSDLETLRANDTSARLQALEASFAKLEETASALSASASDSDAEQKSRDFIVASLKPIEERLAKSEKTIRAHGQKIAEQKSIDSLLESKANVREVPSMAQFNKLSAAVEKKATANKVPTLAQVVELQEMIEKKVSQDSVPSNSEFKELTRHVEKQLKDRGVPDSLDLLKLAKDVQAKANQSDVESRMAKIEEQKANADQVPLSSALENLAAVMEKKLAFLAAKVHKTSEIVDQHQNQFNQAMFCYVPHDGSQWPVAGGNGTNGNWQQAHQGYAPGGWFGQQADRTDGQATPSQKSPRGSD